MGRPGWEERARVASAFDELAAGRAFEHPLDLELLLDIHREACGGGELRTTQVRIGPPGTPSPHFPPSREVEARATEALARANDPGVSPLLAAARLHLELLLVHPFRDGNGRAARLAASVLLMRVGCRSTLLTAVEQHFADEPSEYGHAFRRLGQSDQEDHLEWLGAALGAMAKAGQGAAWFRERELRLRRALETAGVEGREQDDTLVAFDRGQLRSRDLRPRLEAISPPWPDLVVAGAIDPTRVLRQLRRLRAEELDRTPTRRGVSIPAGAATPAAAVVIPAYDAAKTIAACLAAIDTQDLGEPFEVVVVVSGSDGTAEIVRGRFPWITVIRADRRLSPGAGRNLGLGQTSAPIVAFLAADCVPAVDWLRRRVEAHRAGHALVGGFIDIGPSSTIAGWAQYLVKFWGMLGYDGLQTDGVGPLFHLSYVRQVLEQAGPFPEGAIAGEDTAYNHHLVANGLHVHFDSAIRVRHLNARTWSEVAHGQREQGAAVGAMCRQQKLGQYYARSLRGGPLATPALVLAAVVAVARHRPRWLLRCLSSLPLMVAAVVVRRRAFRTAYRTGIAAPSEGIDSGAVVTVFPATPVPVPVVTAIVPAFDEGRTLGACLDSLAGQTVSGLEVIVADDGSRDDTVPIALGIGVRVMGLDHAGPARAKNLAARVARGRVLVFLDADLRADPDCLRQLAEPILAGSAVGTFTPSIGVANPGWPWADCWSINRGVPPGRYMPDGVPSRWANFRAVDRRAFLAAGGYDDVGYGEDMTLAPKLGELALAVPDAHLRHHNPDRLAEIWANARWVGRARAWEWDLRRGPGPWRSLARGWRGALRHRQPRYLLFAPIYDLGLLIGSIEGRWRPDRHWK